MRTAFIVCDVALADLFSDVAPVCLIIASIVLLITFYRLTVASLVDGEGAKANRNFLNMRPDNVSGPRCCHSPTSLAADRSTTSDLDGCVM
jgi:hypothetical protein